MKVLHLIQKILSEGFIMVAYLAFVQNNRLCLVLIMSDNFGWGDLLCYGNKFNEASHIDQLVQKGAVFINVYSASAVSSQQEPV